CSTLLARCLEALPRCFVLKEPYLLTQIAILRDYPSAFPPSWTERIVTELPDWLDMSTLLLSRAYGREDTVVIKTNDLCNGLGREFLPRDPRSKIIFQQSPLRTFLLSVLKDEERRAWLRERITILTGPFAAIPGIEGLVGPGSADAELAVALWLFNCALGRELLTGPEPE